MHTRYRIPAPIVILMLLSMLFSLTARELPKGGAPICDFGELVRPEVIFPEMYAVLDDLTPAISWEFPGSGCLPEFTNLEVWSVENYLHGASAGYLVMGGHPVGYNFTWPEDNPLLPGHTYFLRLTPTAVDGESYLPGPGAFVAFSTGPVCGAGEMPVAPRPHWFPNDWTVDPTPGFSLEWNNNLTCWPEDGFVVQLSRTPTFTRVIEMTTPMESLWVYSGMVADLPIANCTRYFWRVRADLPGRDDEPWSETWTFTTHIPMTFCLEDVFRPYLDELPIVTPPIATLIDDAACRSGPSMDYAIVDYLAQGLSLPISGRNPTSTWWQVYLPNLNSCWVYEDLVDIGGDTGLVMVIDPEPPHLVLPTATHTPESVVNCAQYTNPNTCIANPACWWDSSVPPNGVCKNK